MLLAWSAATAATASCSCASGGTSTCASLPQRYALSCGGVTKLRSGWWWWCVWGVGGLKNTACRKALCRFLGGLTTGRVSTSSRASTVGATKALAGPNLLFFSTAIGSEQPSRPAGVGPGDGRRRWAGRVRRPAALHQQTLPRCTGGRKEAPAAPLGPATSPTSAVDDHGAAAGCIKACDGGSDWQPEGTCLR